MSDIKLEQLINAFKISPSPSSSGYFWSTPNGKQVIMESFRHGNRNRTLMMCDDRFGNVWVFAYGSPIFVLRSRDDKIVFINYDVGKVERSPFIPSCLNNIKCERRTMGGRGTRKKAIVSTHEAFMFDVVFICRELLPELSKSFCRKVFFFADDAELVVEHAKIDREIVIARVRDACRIARDKEKFRC